VGLIVQNDIKQRRMDSQFTVVIDEAKFPKFIHENTHAEACRAYDFRERCLADLRNYQVRGVFLAIMCHQKERPRQPFLAGIEQLVNQVVFDPYTNPEYRFRWVW
jgi:hypothetical protein